MKAYGFRAIAAGVVMQFFAIPAVTEPGVTPVATGSARITVLCPFDGGDPCSSPQTDWARPAALSAVRLADGSIVGELALHSPAEVDFGFVRIDIFANLHAKLDCAKPFGANTMILSGLTTFFRLHLKQWFAGVSGPEHVVVDDGEGDHLVFVVEDNGHEGDRVTTAFFCSDLADVGYVGPCEQMCKFVDPTIAPLSDLVELESGNVTVWE